MGIGFNWLGGGVLLRVAAELETEADVDLSFLPVLGVGKPQCHERLANQLYGILSRAGLYWSAGWGYVPSNFVQCPSAAQARPVERPSVMSSVAAQKVLQKRTLAAVSTFAMAATGGS